MPTPSFPINLLSRPFASEGAYRIIPDSDAGSGRASQTQGFPVETQRPLSQGGVAPNRTDFNGMFYMLSAFAFWQQSGGMAVYNAALNYTVPNVVFYGDKLWWCVKDNGPDVSETGAVAPGKNEAYWQEFLLAMAEASGNTSMFGNPVGTVITFYGTKAPEGYLACNGAAFSATAYPQLYTLLGKATTPDMRGYFVRGYDTGNTVDPDGAARAIGSVQGDAIRNITAYAEVSPEGTNGGAFYRTKERGYVGMAEEDKDNWLLRFDASRVVPVADENRPKNICLLYCIKHD